MVREGLRPVAALEKVPVLPYSDNQQTTHGPMAQLMSRAGEAATQPGVVAAYILPVQPWLDVPDLGMNVLVTVVKSPNLFRASYEPVAKRIIIVDGPGASTSNYARLPFKRIPRPIFPLDAMAENAYLPRQG